jgi:hypothetical protein
MQALAAFHTVEQLVVAIPCSEVALIKLDECPCIVDDVKKEIQLDAT